MPPDPVELLLPDTLDRAAAVELFAERLRLDSAPPRKADRTLLDSFDGRLRKAGLRAERAARGPLTLYEPGAPVRKENVARERLAEVLEERALLPVVRVRSEIQPLAVLDADEKSVVRLSIERPEAVLGAGTHVALAARVTVRPVLGYDAAFARTLRVLRDRLGLQPAERSLFDEASLAAGRDPSGVSSKPKFRLPKDTRSDAAGRIALNALAEIAEANLPGTVDDLDTEFLHDLRVSIRRARSVLRELDGVFEPMARARLREDLKWAQQLTGPTRDLDVQLLEWDELVAHVGPDRAGDLGALRALLERRRARELTKMRRGLRSARFERTLREWRALVEGGERADEPIADLAGTRIRKVYGRMVRDGRKISDDTPAEALHELRKRGKELRYLLELFGDPFPSKVVKEMISTLKDLQDVLGRFQDRAVQVESLRELRDELAAEKDGPAALLALGPALDALLEDQRAARAQFAERFAGFSSKPHRRLVKDSF